MGGLVARTETVCTEVTAADSSNVDAARGGVEISEEDLEAVMEALEEDIDMEEEDFFDFGRRLSSMDE